MNLPSKKFSWSDGKGGVAGVGTRLAINKHAMLPDGRMFVESRGE